MRDHVFGSYTTLILLGLASRETGPTLCHVRSVLSMEQGGVNGVGRTSVGTVGLLGVTLINRCHISLRF